MAEQNVRTIHGPGRRGGMGPRPKVANPGKLLKRVLGEVLRHYTPHCVVVLICIFLSAFANVQASLFLQTLIDDYIAPMLQQQDPDFGPLIGALARIGCIYLVGILAAWGNAPHHGQCDPGHHAEHPHRAVHPHGEPAHQLL